MPPVAEQPYVLSWYSDWLTGSDVPISLRLFLDDHRVVDLYSGAIPQGAQHFVAAGDDLIAFLQAVLYFNLGRAGQPRFDGHKLGFAVAHHENTLKLFFWLLRSGRGGAFDGCLALLRFQIGFIADGERLDGNGHGIGPRAGRDFRGGRQSGPQVFRRILQRNGDFEILGFLTAGVALRGRQAAGTDDGVVADLRYIALKRLARNGVDGDVRRLPQFYVHDIGFIHLHFDGNDLLVGNGHQGASRRILNAHHHGLAFAYGQVRYHAVKGRGVSGL